MTTPCAPSVSPLRNRQYGRSTVPKPLIGSRPVFCEGFNLAPDPDLLRLPLIPPAIRLGRSASISSSLRADFVSQQLGSFCNPSSRTHSPLPSIRMKLMKPTSLHSPPTAFRGASAHLETNSGA